MAILKLSSHDVHYQIFGDASKPTLIFSNSLGTNLSMWEPQYAVLQAAYCVVCYDTRGHGLSGAPKGPYTLAELGEDVLALLDHLQVEEAHFCGISMGGITGLWLAINHPERFLSVSVCNSAAKIGQEGPWRERAALVREQGLHPIASTAAGRWFTADFVSSHPDTISKMQQDLAAGSAEGYASCCEALAVADVRAQLGEIQIPLLLVAGTEDPVTTVADAEFMQVAVAGSKLYAIPASHISNIEAPEAFNQALGEFLDSL
ncbi:3-oxoadipate enol-lactonase [Vitreoscilla massiliensis]|uniref:3-oxoadipate enol-lactonase n=1 Tax=Vitreoscilla massiliensis TaxID=1689272 RepID=A0ABY4E564_9NEIS|nr:3-oxoadipate enol-lactonase [Vitreoscilla massiliensis]UOO90531.1 3-oxoadipate enol-lactonase [Vitreoscilla massiliensis]